MSKLSFRARALDASKPMPIYLAEELPDLPDYSAINRAVPQMPSGMEKEEESEHHLQRAISGTGLIIPTPEVCQVSDLEFYERCYPPDYKMPKQHIHMQPLWEEQEAPEYDIDSEDERWLKQQRHPELTELKFEQMMDKLEKCSGQTVVTLNEAKLLLERHDDLVIAVYDYWLNKRLNTQHALILSVKTENRPGQSSNNPYLAFRRRTEKMQTRKNRKNDESSYEKMLKLRRDLARALSLLELVARRERAKRELVRLTGLIAERRYATGDFANHVPDPPPRPAYTAVSLSSSNFRREAYTIPHYPPRPPPTPVDQPRQREKRPYKRRKHRHPAVGSVHALRDSGVYTSSEEEAAVALAGAGAAAGGARAETASPPDDGPFAFRRKPGCYYEMPTSTLCGDPVEAATPSKEGLYEHELDERNRYTLTSVSHPYPMCVGFARRRVGRGGRVLLDRRATPLDDLWPDVDFNFAASTRYRRQRDEEVELETKAHRTPKEMSRDYHTSGKYPWRHAFRKHFSRKPDLWMCPVKTDELDVKPSLDDIKPCFDEIKPSLDDITPSLDEFKTSFDEIKPSLDDVRTSLDDLRPSLNDVSSNIDGPSLDDVGTYLEDVKDEMDILPDVIPQTKSDISDSARTIDGYVRGNLDRVMRKRAWSACSDNSYDSDESLQPVEREFEKFINEVNKKWLHFRPKTPPQSPPTIDKHDDQFPLSLDVPISVELRAAETPPSDVLDTFTTSEFTLGELCVGSQDVDHSGSTLDISGDELMTDNFTGLTEAQVESILSETDLKALAEEDDKKMNINDDILEELVNNVDGKESFLLHGQSSEGRADSGPRKRKAEQFGSSVVNVTPVDSEPVYVDVKAEPQPPPSVVTPKHKEKSRVEPPAPVPTSNIIVEEVNEVPIKVEKKKKEDTIEEVQLAHGVQLKTVQTKHSPLKKHIITSAAHRRASEVTLPTCSATVGQMQDAAPQPQIVTVAVSDNLKVRLQNHLLSTQAGLLVQNGPFPPVAVAVPVQSTRDTGCASVSVSPSPSAAPGAPGAARRVSAPLVQLAAGKQLHLHAHPHHAHQPLVVTQSHPIHHLPPNKLKVLHAHSLTHSQRTHLLAQNRVAQLPTVVSLATLGEAKATNSALLKAAPGSVAQLFEIKSGQLGKGPHLVNVVRQPQPGKTTVTRLDLNDKKRQVVATFDGTLKGNIAAAPRPHRVSVSLDGRQIVRAALPAVRAPHVRHQIQLKNRTLQVAPQIARSSTEPSTSITIAAPTKTASIPSSVVANLLQKNVQLPKGGQKIAISGPGGQLSANVQAIAFTTAAQLKARQARLIAQPRAPPVAEIVDANTAPVATSSAAGNIAADTHETNDAEEAATNGTVRRRTADTLPMEVT